MNNIEVIDTSKAKVSNAVKSISIVNSDNGKRVSLSNSLLAELDYPDSLQFAGDATGKVLYIANDLGGTQKHQNVKYGKNGIIYNSALVQKLTDMFSIDYTDRTSATFSNIEIDKDDETNMKIAAVHIE